MANHKVIERFTQLYSLKNKWWLQSKADVWEKKANLLEEANDMTNDFRTQVWYAVKKAKDAELLASLPDFTFIPLTKEARTNKKIVWKIWDYWWLMDNTDKKLNEVISQATTYWTWVLYEWIKHEYRITKVPTYVWEWKDLTIEFKEDTKLIYSWIYSEIIPFKNFFINWTNLDNSTEFIIVRYYDLDAYVKEKELDKSFKHIEKLKKWWGYSPLAWTKWFEEVKDLSADQWKVVEIEYVNEANDERIILANWLEVLNTPIPYTHKKMPIVLFTDELADWRIYWLWTFEQTEKDEKYKNEST